MRLPLYLLPVFLATTVALAAGFGLYPFIGLSSILAAVLAGGVVLDLTIHNTKCARCGCQLTRPMLQERITSFGISFQRHCPRCGYDNLTTPPFRHPQNELPPLSAADQNVRPDGHWVRGYRQVKQRYIQARSQLQLGEPGEAKATIAALPAIVEKYHITVEGVPRAIEALEHRIDLELEKQADAVKAEADQQK